MTDQWEVREHDCRANIPAGWEPFAVTVSDRVYRVWVRRMKPDSHVKAPTGHQPFDPEKAEYVDGGIHRHAIPRKRLFAGTGQVKQR